MTNIELAKKALESVKDTEITILLSAYEGGTCGDGWTDYGTLYLSRPQILYLISSECEDESIFDGLETEEIDLEDEAMDMAESGAFPEGRDDEFEHWKCSYEIERALNFVESWTYLLNRILQGLVSEDKLENWLSYFDDEENFEFVINDDIEDE